MESISINQSNQIKTNMFLVVLGKFISLFGTQIYNFALSFYILKITGSGITFAISLTVGALPRAILSPFAGAFSDIFDRKKTIVLTDILSGVIVLLFFVVSLVTDIKMIEIYITMFLLSVLNIFFTVAVDASLPNIVKKDQLTRINALNQGATSSALILAPIVGGGIINFIDIRLFIFINAISFILSGFSEMFIKFDVNDTGLSKEKKSEKPTFKSILINIHDGYLYVKSNKFLFTLIIFFLCLNFFFTLGYVVPLPYIIVDLLNLKSIEYGIIQSSASVGALVTSILLSFLPENANKYKMFVIFSSFVAVAIILVGVAAIPALFQLNTYIVIGGLILASLLFGVSVIMSSIPINVMIQSKTPNEYRGRVQGLVKASGAMVGPIAMLLSGTLIDVIPTYIIPLTSGVFMLSFIFILSIKSEIKEI